MDDVIIAGAGPVGLLLACELALQGCSVVVLERDPDPHSPFKSHPLGTRGLSAGSVEAFYRRGMLAELLAAAGADDYPGPDAPTAPRQVSHFAGIMLDAALVDPGTLPLRLPSPALEGIITNLEAIESVLTSRAAKLGVRIERGVAVTGVSQDDGSVTVRAGDLRFEARWLVGCDGGRSAVRGLAGFGFAGTEPQLTGYLMLADIAEPSPLRPGFNLTPTGMYLRMNGAQYVGMMDFDGGAYDRSQRPALAHLQEVLRRVSGTGVTLTAVHEASTFTDRAMQATTYRRGRVLLAGDAAHIHSPLGGQGLNTGLGDAFNLGWKLAAAVHGSAPDGLLDTYTQERHPIGARVLDWTRVQVAAMRPDPHSQAIQAMIRDLFTTGDGTTWVFTRMDTMTGLSVRYDLGSDRPLIGRNAPDFRLADGTRLGDLMTDGRGVLLDFGGARRDTAPAQDDRIRYVAGPALDTLGCEGVLIRPDGIVVWDGTGSLAQAVHRWF